MSQSALCWVDGDLLPIDHRALRPDDSAFSLGRGCYTTSRFRNGRIRFLERHAARVVRDARRLEIGEVDEARVAEALEATGQANFAEIGDGVVRVLASRDGDGAIHLTGVPRSPGDEPPSWRACIADVAHEGPMPWSGAKVSNHLLFALASDHARRAGYDESLLLDRDGYLVEGSRSNLLVVDPRGGLATPDLARGGVTGVGLEVLRAYVPGIAVRHISGSELSTVRELIAVNALRGPKPIVCLDGRDVGDGRPGPVSKRLSACFEDAGLEASGSTQER